MLDFRPCMLKNRSHLHLCESASELLVLCKLNPFGLQAQKIVNTVIAKAVTLEKFLTLVRALDDFELRPQELIDIGQSAGKVGDDSNASQVSDLFQRCRVLWACRI